MVGWIRWHCPPDDEVKNATYPSRRLPTILNPCEWAGKKHFVSLKLKDQSGSRAPQCTRGPALQLEYCSAKPKCRYLLTLQASRYWHLALQNRVPTKTFMYTYHGNIRFPQHSPFSKIFPNIFEANVLENLETSLKDMDKEVFLNYLYILIQISAEGKSSRSHFIIDSPGVTAFSHWQDALNHEVTTQQTRDIHPRLFQCWPSVCKAGPTLQQPLINVSRFLYKWAVIACFSLPRSQLQVSTYIVCYLNLYTRQFHKIIAHFSHKFAFFWRTSKRLESSIDIITP